MECELLRSPMISYRSLLCNTTVLYDKGICDGKLIFSAEDLQDMDIIKDQVNGLGLLVAAPSTSIYGIKMSYNFLHMTLQEFCAA